MKIHLTAARYKTDNNGLEPESSISPPLRNDIQTNLNGGR